VKSSFPDGLFGWFRNYDQTADGFSFPRKKNPLPPNNPKRNKVGAVRPLNNDESMQLKELRRQSKASPTTAKINKLKQFHAERVDLFHRFPIAGTKASEPSKLEFRSVKNGLGKNNKPTAPSFVETSSGTATASSSAEAAMDADQDVHALPCPSVFTRAKVQDAVIAAHLANMAYSIGSSALVVGQNYTIASVTNVKIHRVLLTRLSRNRPELGEWADYVGPAYIAFNANTIFVAVRGSASVGDWIYGM